MPPPACAATSKEAVTRSARNEALQEAWVRGRFALPPDRPCEGRTLEAVLARLSCAFRRKRFDESGIQAEEQERINHIGESVVVDITEFIAWNTGYQICNPLKDDQSVQRIPMSIAVDVADSPPWCRRGRDCRG